MQIDINSTGRFGNALKGAVEASGMSLTQLAQKVDSTYEHMRKLVAGRAYPSVHLLRALANTLHADREKWSELIEADKLFRRYKNLPKFLNVSSTLEPFQAIVPRLSEANREVLLEMAKTLLRTQSTG